MPLLDAESGFRSARSMSDMPVQQDLTENGRRRCCSRERVRLAHFRPSGVKQRADIRQCVLTARRAAHRSEPETPHIWTCLGSLWGRLMSICLCSPHASSRTHT